MSFIVLVLSRDRPDNFKGAYQLLFIFNGGERAAEIRRVAPV